MSKMNEERKDSLFVKYLFLISIILLVFVYVIFRATYIYLAEGEEWRKLSQDNIFTEVVIDAQRGDILSHDGKVLASSIPYYYLLIDFQADGYKAERYKKEVDSIFRKNLPELSRKLSVKIGDKSPHDYERHIMNGYRTKSRQFQLTRKRVSFVDKLEIQEFPFFSLSKGKTGLYDKELLQREKPFGSLASRTIGDVYADKGKGGKNGLELAFDSLLRGEPGKGIRRRMRGYNVIEKIKEPKNGLDIVTTIDVKTQDIVERVLRDQLQTLDAEMGLVVLMDVKTGEVRAISNMGRIADGVYAETKNHAVADELEPGSTFKIASMMVALEDKVIDESDSVFCENGAWAIHRRVMKDHNWNKGGYGWLTVPEIIHNSSNIGIAKIIEQNYSSNPAKFVEGLYRIGLNKTFWMPIPGAGVPKIKHPIKNKDFWWSTTLPWMSMGYETQIPPIYSLTFFNAIANGGKMVAPHFVKRIVDKGTTIQEFRTEVLNSSICSYSTLNKLKRMMEGVVQEGTGKGAYSPYIKIAGKTGTAQVSLGKSGYGMGGHQVSFCGYFPADEPQYTGIVVIRRPRNGYASGGAMAGAVLRKIAEQEYARTFTLSPKDLPVDSTLSLVPTVKGGNLTDLEKVINEFDIEVQSSEEISDTKCVRTESYDKGIGIIPVPIRDGLVPNVVGMGLKDALYLLETQGLRVTVNGHGRVVSQSIPNGSRAVKGQTIGIRLN
ncbi:MAG: penicillin-binding transpeptidase domain-containing protein [Bacteroidales bacterium]